MRRPPAPVRRARPAAGPAGTPARRRARAVPRAAPAATRAGTTCARVRGTARGRAAGRGRTPARRGRARPAPRAAADGRGRADRAGSTRAPYPAYPDYGPRPGLDFMAPMEERDFPLFPLGIVALPSEVVPLHIFEERYKTMIEVCLEEEREFGIVWLSDDGLKSTGCAVEVAEVLERLEDGRLNIVCRGTRPVRILERQEDLPYPAGVVEFPEDKAEVPDQKVVEQAHDIYADLVEQVTDRRPDTE